MKQLNELGGDGDGVLGDHRVRAKGGRSRHSEIESRLDQTVTVAVLLAHTQTQTREEIWGKVRYQCYKRDGEGIFPPILEFLRAFTLDLLTQTGQ